MAASEVGMLVRCLHSDDATVSRNAACRLKDMVVASNPDQRSNQDLIAGVDGAVDGLVNILQRGSPDGKYHACYCLAQLAWSNERNSLLIPSVGFPASASATRARRSVRFALRCSCLPARSSWLTSTPPHCADAWSAGLACARPEPNAASERAQRRTGVRGHHPRELRSQLRGGSANNSQAPWDR